MRIPTSCEDMVNGWPSFVSGLSKRPPTEWVASIPNSTSSLFNNVSYNLIEYADGSKYILVLGSGVVKLFDMNGVEQVVSIEEGSLEYLSKGDASPNKCKALTIGDTSFILNTQSVIETRSALGISASSSIDTTIAYEGVMEDIKDEEAFGNWLTMAELNRKYPPENYQEGTILLVKRGAVVTSANERRYIITAVPVVEGAWKSIGGGSMTVQPGALPPSSLGGYRAVSALPTAGTDGEILSLWMRSPMNNSEFNDTISYTVYEYHRGNGGKEWTAWEAGGVVQIAPTLDPGKTWTVHVKQSAANSYYNVYYRGGLAASYLSPKGVDEDSSVPGTDIIARRLLEHLRRYDALNEFSSYLTGSSIVLVGTRLDNLKVYFDATSNAGDQIMGCYGDSIARFSDLAPRDAHNRLVRVRGSSEDDGDDYYVKFSKYDSSWTEDVGYGHAEYLTKSTMPHTLVREAGGTWSFRKLKNSKSDGRYFFRLSSKNDGSFETVSTSSVWGGYRSVGDARSNPSPSFVGNTITDMFVYNNRLCFLSDENIIMSEVGNYENFYRTTVATQLDSDPIDIASPSTMGSKFYHALPFNKDLILMSDRVQYRLTYSGYLGPKNIQLQHSTNFDVSPTVAPVALESSVYFVEDRLSSRFAQLWEFFPKNDATGDGASKATSGVPEYVPGRISWMTASQRHSMVVMKSYDDPATLYVYKYLWADDRKIQNAWSKWTFPAAQDVIWGEFVEDYLYLVIKRNNVVHIERILCAEKILNDVGKGYTMLDMLITKDKLTGISGTSIDVPYNMPAGIRAYAVVQYYSAVAGKVISESIPGTLTGRRISLSKTLPAAYSELFVGIPYTFSYTFTNPYMRQEKQSGEVVVKDDIRLQLRYFTLEYLDTASFRLEIEYPGRETNVREFDGKTMGGQTMTLGGSNFSSGLYRIAIAGNNRDMQMTLINDGPLNSTFSSAEWLCTYVPRAKLRA